MSKVEKVLKETSPVSPSQKYLSQVIYNNLYSSNNWAFKDLTGKLLTLVDAIFTDPEQRKAVKDNVQQIISSHRNTLTRDYRSICGEVYLVLKEANGPKDQDENLPYFVPRDWEGRLFTSNHTSIDESINLSR